MDQSLRANGIEIGVGETSWLNLADLKEVLQQSAELGEEMKQSKMMLELGKILRYMIDLGFAAGHLAQLANPSKR